LEKSKNIKWFLTISQKNTKRNGDLFLNNDFYRILQDNKLDKEFYVWDILI
jgi:hypothetical protein